MGQQKKTTWVPVGDVEPPRHSGRANAGAGGEISQSRRVGNAIQSPVKVLKPNAPNVVVPPDKIENAMAPSNLKKKKGARQRKPAVTPVVLLTFEFKQETSGPTAAGPAPVLHVAKNGRFGLQDYPLPSAYVSSKPLQTDHTAHGSRNPLQPGSTSHVQPPAHPVQPPARPVQPPARPAQPPAHPVKPIIKPSARPVESRVLPVESLARPVQHTGALARFCRSRSSSFTSDLNFHTSGQQEPSTIWRPLPGSSVSFVRQNVFADGSDDENEETQMDREMEDFDMEKNQDADLEENLDISFEEDNGEEIQDADFKEDNGEEDGDIDIDLEEDEVDAAIGGEEHDDGDGLGDGDLYGTVTAPINHSNPEDHIYRPGQAEKHVNNGARKQAGCPQANSKQAPSRGKEVPNINYDLLQRHHSNNRRPRSPSPSYLIDVREQQSNPRPKPKRPRKNDPSPANDGSDCDDNNEFERDSGVQSCATKKNKNAKGTANPTTLGFFPPLWIKLLDFAKANFRQHLAIVAPFPQRESAIDEGGVCGEMIAEAIIYWQEQKCQLEKGYYPKFKAEMAIVIFNDAATFRSKIKQVALAVVPLEYELVSQGGTIAAVKIKASGLIRHLLFLCGVVDTHGHSSNFAHNALRSVCLRVFYDSGSKSLRQFPAFRKTIPDNAVILVATIVRNILDIYARHGQANTKQTNIVDSEVIYKKIAGLFKHVKDDEYHGPKLHKMLQSWAQTGITIVDHQDRNEVAMSGEDEDGGSEWEVDLN
ncbi:uncharacterized protein F5147DRAFT_658271 [Suillus discolor]|uniref:DUF6532 domain-containing protein n=1 Tax=Suillus discolor TaxID=1912936 RepID=A0A9P7ETW3_9AGAM|nr:uncharacterized protein F5147DRAFT_658271 [Suillus discolor]KAG2090008.1 hypothetical protein F5147DRAFT_658271 [Suillus discolor]